MFKLIEGQCIWPTRARAIDVVYEALGYALFEPVVVWPTRDGWTGHSVLPQEAAKIPKEMIQDIYEARKVGNSLFPEVGRVYVLNGPVEMVFPVQTSWRQQTMEMGT